MPKDNYLSLLEDSIMDGIMDIYNTVQETYPSNSVIQSTLMMSYQQLTPQEQVQIVEQLGSDWFVKLSARIERRLRGLTD